jgi:hypothetical protein
MYPDLQLGLLLLTMVLVVLLLLQHRRRRHGRRGVGDAGLDRILASNDVRYRVGRRGRGYRPAISVLYINDPPESPPQVLCDSQTLR